MKKLPFFTVLAFAFPLMFGAAVPGLRAEPSKHSANHVHARADSLENTKFSLDVGWVQAFEGSNTEDVSFFAAHTWDEREKLPGGIITVAVDAKSAKSFVDKYGSGPDVEKRGWYADIETRRLTGFLRKGQKNRLFLDMTTVGVDAYQVPTGHPIAEAFAEIVRRLLEKREQR